MGDEERARLAVHVDLERTRRGLSLRQVAEEAGVSASSLSRLRIADPSLDTLARILRWSGGSADEVLSLRPRDPGAPGARAERVSAELSGMGLTAAEVVAVLGVVRILARPG